MKLVQKPWGLVLRRRYSRPLVVFQIMFFAWIGFTLTRVELGLWTAIVAAIFVCVAALAFVQSFSSVEVDRRRRELRLRRLGIVMDRVPFQQVESLAVERTTPVGASSETPFRHLVVCRDGRRLPFFPTFNKGDLPRGTLSEFEAIAQSMRQVIETPMEE